ncbi:MAG: hypothetical protein FWB80_00680 [Defluviitaleaceae bacterium]|nr:hypothetical protein [Defluviitaleaceae bacterium]
MHIFVVLIIIISFISLCFKLLALIITLCEMRKEMSKYRLGLFREFLVQLRNDENIKQDDSWLDKYSVEKITCRAYLFPILARGVILSSSISYIWGLSRHVSDTNDEANSFWENIWSLILHADSLAYNLIKNIDMLASEHLIVGVPLLSILFSLVCISLVLWNYLLYSNAFSKLEYYISQKLFIDTLSKANKGIDPEVIARMEKTLDSTSKISVDFTNFMDNINNSLESKKETYSNFNLEMDLRINEIKHVIDGFNNYTQDFSKSLSNSIHEAIHSERKHMEEAVDEISEDFINGGVSQGFVAVSDAMSQMAKQLDSTVFTMQSISEEFNKSVKTYVWFNETAIKAAEQLKSASNEFRVAAQPFNEMIGTTTDVMRQTIGHLNYMGYASIQAVADALEKKVDISLESREEWMKVFAESVITVFETNMKEFHEKLLIQFNNKEDVNINKIDATQSDTEKEQFNLAIEKIIRDKLAYEAIKHITRLRELSDHQQQ